MEQSFAAFAKKEPALRSLQLTSIPDVTNEFYPTYRMACEQLLISSQSTLQVLSIEMSNGPEFAVQLSRFFPGPVMSLKSLILRSKDGAGWLSILRHLDFTLFPAVRHISLNDDKYNGEYVLANMANPTPPVPSVMSLHLNVLCRGVYVTRIFRPLFSNITTLHVEINGGKRLFPLICHKWPNLEELAIRYCRASELRFDAGICGIFEEEADYLRQKSVEYLQAVHIVPVRPALTTMPSKFSE